MFVPRWTSESQSKGHSFAFDFTPSFLFKRICLLYGSLLSASLKPFLFIHRFRQLPTDTKSASQQCPSLATTVIAALWWKL
ncbi:hypothetical protein, conserved [Leishmania donovani]|uniref:Uncharacterized protein n=1 Tax=Leishmania donovani TaxID=5661 RepID=E9BGM0_LEIDO|nr:hypothetical protein, conserved [Leishmania donovani]CBZ34396.1 hypothetical protein, conserved [Leishmania donovani]